MRIKRILAILLTLALLFTTACEFDSGNVGVSQPSETQAQTSAADLQKEVSLAETEARPDEQTGPATEALPDTEEAETENVINTNASLPAADGYYYDVTNVVLYLELYGKLPPNFITKAEARELGWQGGSVEDYLEGAAIGGDYFGNYEELLPKADGRSYTECDIDTNGYHSRGSRRLIFSNDGLYFYTSDHYETFSEVIVTEDYEVIW